MQRHSSAMVHLRAFTLIELLVVISIIALLIGILLPALGSARKTARQMQNNTQLRGIHQSLVMYAQGNKGFYPGVDTRGWIRDLTGVIHDHGASVDDRVILLLMDNYFTGDYAVSPAETVTAWTTSAYYTSSMFSYALLAISTAHPPSPSTFPGRAAEWRETMNTQAAIISDRAKGPSTSYYSVHTEPGDGWRGGVAFNDNHVTFENTQILTTKYSDGSLNHLNDDIFEFGDGTDIDSRNAWMLAYDIGVLTVTDPTD